MFISELVWCGHEPPVSGSTAQVERLREKGEAQVTCMMDLRAYWDLRVLGLWVGGLQGLTIPVDSSKENFCVDTPWHPHKGTK